MQNRGRVINIRSKVPVISDDIDTEDNLSLNPLSESKLNGISNISTYQEYRKVLYTLRYLESKHESDLTETDEEMIEKSKLLIRKFKHLIETERLGLNNGDLPVNISDGALKIIISMKSIDTEPIANALKETLGLLQTIEEETMSTLEFVTIQNLEELIEKYDSGGWVDAK